MEIIFLGTGPAGGIQAKGKSARFESSCLIKTPLVNTLIDITTDFQKQLIPIKTLDAVLITHGHHDAIGGIGDFILWQIKKGGVVPMLTLEPTINTIKKHFKSYLDLLDLHPIKPFKKFQLGDLMITPFKVKHSLQPGFPTLGFHLNYQAHQVAYVSDVGSWDKRAEQLMKVVDLLIVDGAMWGKKIKSHLDIKEILPKICLWPVKQIIFTQIGKLAPKHQILQKEIKKICPKALPAYDGMRLKLKQI